MVTKYLQELPPGSNFIWRLTFVDFECILAAHKDTGKVIKNGSYLLVCVPRGQIRYGFLLSPTEPLGKKLDKCLVLQHKFGWLQCNQTVEVDYES